MKLAKLNEGAEIFYTLQGEGISVGAPAVFVRLSLCNLHCVWCDTDHTWNFLDTPWKHEKEGLVGYSKHRKEDVMIDLSPASIAEIVRAYACRRVVLTGGEPLLQQAELSELIAMLRQDGKQWFFEVETNGTILPVPAFLHAVDQLNVSPKLSNSEVSLAQRWKPLVLEGLIASGKAWFKFVIRKEEDLEEVQSILAQVGIEKERVILMPEGRNLKSLDENAAWLAGRCRDLGFRFSDRLHVRLWGDRRGV